MGEVASILGIGGGEEGLEENNAASLQMFLVEERTEAAASRGWNQCSSCLTSALKAKLIY